MTALDRAAIGERIVKVREAMGFTRAELARHLGIPYQTVEGYEKGLRMPILENLCRLAFVLRRSLDFVILGTARSDRRCRGNVSAGRADMSPQLRKG